MRSISSRLKAACSLLLILAAAVMVRAQAPADTSISLPKNVGDFRAQATRQLTSPMKFAPEEYGVIGAAEGTYVAGGSGRFTVTAIKTDSQAAAYALLSEVSAQIRAGGNAAATKEGEMGIAGILAPGRAAFYRGTTFVNIAGSGPDEGSLAEFARAFAKTVEEGENAIPVLVRHLPDWETASGRAIYAVSLKALQRAAGQRPALDAVVFDKDTEAVTAPYDSARLVIVEYTTPQIADLSDAQITARIKELSESGKPVPTSYRRVGNYSVFVFDALDESAAAGLIDQVKYEQKIQWLGENPFLWAEYQERSTQHTQKAVSLILGIAKTIGFFLVVCLGGGGLVGGLFFLRRRAQQRAMAADGYTDAGGMLRLNLDDMSPETDPARLLSSGDGKPVVQ